MVDGAVTHLGADRFTRRCLGRHKTVIARAHRTDSCYGDREMAKLYRFGSIEIENGLITAWREYFDLPPGEVSLLNQVK